MTWEEIFETGNWEMGCLLAWDLNYAIPGKTKPNHSTLWVKYLGGHNPPEVKPFDHLYEVWYRK